MSLKQKLHEIIFEAETRPGRLFDIVLIVTIILSVATAMLESVESLSQGRDTLFLYLEIFFTLFFTVEYFLRLYCSSKTTYYIFSFFGIVDFLATLPLYLSFVLPGAQGLSIVRGLRITRIFRVLKLTRYSLAGQQLSSAMRQSWPKILVFLIAVISVVSIMGALIFLIEGKENGFTSIPRGVYWAVVTMTTVGYGDLAPQTSLGQFMSVVLMIFGYGIIAVPTGIVSSEIIQEKGGWALTMTCEQCLKEGHEMDANYCNRCGHSLNKKEE